MNIAIYDASDRIVGRARLAKGGDSALYERSIPISDQMAITPLEITHRVSSETLIGKATVVMSASKTAIAADGVDVSTVSFAGLEGAATVVVKGVKITVTASDPWLVLSSELPAQLSVRGVNDALHYFSGGLTVVASGG